MKQMLKIVAAASLVVAVAAVVGVSAASASPTCNTGHVCAWTEPNFQGAKGESLCTGGKHPLGGFKWSSYNHCANKAVWIRIDGEAKACLEPSFVDTATRFNELWVGVEGSHC